MTSPVLLVGWLVGPLIGALGLAIRRSIRRQECARLRDQLVDAARTGDLDVADWRVFSLIDWFDQVATTGRTDTPGRHAPDRGAEADTLAGSLAATLVPRGMPVPVDPFWPADPESEVGAELRAAAVRYRDRHQQRLRIWPRRPPPRRPRIAVTGRPKPANGLMPLVDPIEVPAWIDVSVLDSSVLNGSGLGGSGLGGSGRGGSAVVSPKRPEPAVLPSLVEEIFAVAGTES